MSSMAEHSAEQREFLADLAVRMLDGGGYVDVIFGLSGSGTLIADVSIDVTNEECQRLVEIFGDDISRDGPITDDDENVSWDAPINEIDLGDLIRFGRDRLGHVRRGVFWRLPDGTVINGMRCDHDDCPANAPPPAGGVRITPTDVDVAEEHVTCPHCGGSGRLYDTDERGEPCGWCREDGYVTRTEADEYHR